MLGVVSTTTFGPSIAHTGLRRTCDSSRNRTLLTSSAGLEQAKQLIAAYKTGKIQDMSPDLWKAKKIIDSTIHPGTNYTNSEK